jgi:hypothetical protein
MAKTYTKQALAVVGDTTFLAHITRKGFEAASQSAVKVGWPVYHVSGLLTEFVAPSTDLLVGFAAEDFSGTTSAVALFIPAYAGLVRVEGNFLGAAGIDNVLAAADLYLARDIAKLSTLIGGATAGWYILDAAVSATVKISSFEHSALAAPTDNLESIAAVGDTNARVVGDILAAACELTIA